MCSQESDRNYHAVVQARAEAEISSVKAESAENCRLLKQELAAMSVRMTKVEEKKGEQPASVSVCSKLPGYVKTAFAIVGCVGAAKTAFHYMLSYLAEHHILLELPSNVLELAPSTIMQLPSV